MKVRIKETGKKIEVPEWMAWLYYFSPLFLPPVLTLAYLLGRWVRSIF